MRGSSAGSLSVVAEPPLSDSARKGSEKAAEKEGISGFDLRPGAEAVGVRLERGSLCFSGTSSTKLDVLWEQKIYYCMRPNSKRQT